MTTNQKPATPLPYSINEASHPSDQVFDAGGSIVADCKWTKWTPLARRENASYLARAANAYPLLVAALNDLSRPQYEQAYRDGHQWAVAARGVAAALLRSLGESS